MMATSEITQAEGQRREIKGLVWKILHVDESDFFELYSGIGTSPSLAPSWRVGGLKSVVGLPEPQCVADQSVAKELGLDLTKGAVEARRVSDTCVYQRTSFDCLRTLSLSPLIPRLHVFTRFNCAWSS